MNITSDKIERLVFTKYLLDQAETTKELNRPLSSTTILTLHDAVECFLQLSIEQLTGETKPNGQRILDTYSDKINEQLKNGGKPQISKAFIKRINELRNQLKHSSIFIDKKNIQNLFSETDLFLNDFTKIIFDLNFRELSLTFLISETEIQSLLIDAEEKIKNNQFQLAMFSIGKAFYEIEDMGTKVKGKYGENILSKSPNVSYLMKSYARLGGKEPDGAMRENLREIADDINRIQKELHDLKKIISLSADLKKYTELKTILPYVTKIVEGKTGETKYWIPDEENNKKVEYSLEQTKFCFEFVVDLALKQNNY